jgi:antitoxin (DNA-binding transcriptional repressor) of toxin-antitoxin stability system
MNATIVELRYKTKQILQALERREKVNLTWHGAVKGTIMPVGAAARADEPPMAEHPFCRQRLGEAGSVEAAMDALRGGRYRAL